MLIKLLTKVFGSRNDRTLRRMRKVVNIINAMEPQSSARVWKKAKCWKT
ncbi:protein export cytoplasm protein SecA ATPase RNA helicase [Klebsiella pneumoniae]|nr:protein export cytoplasm protein SecA ATPase RNA helicase [Klebsiella pneumoniae]